MHVGVRINGHAQTQHASDALQDAGARLVERGGEGVLDVADVPEHGDAVLVVEGRVARHHLVDQHAQRPPGRAGLPHRRQSDGPRHQQQHWQ